MKRKYNFIFVIAYLALAIPMFYVRQSDFYVGSFGVGYKYLLGIGIILLAATHFLISADLRSALYGLKNGMVLVAPYLWTLAYSLILWVCTLAGFREMTRGTFVVVYQLIAIFAAAGTLYMFGRRGIYLQLLALVCALVLVAAEQIQSIGMAEFFRQYWVNIKSFTRESGAAMRTFEKGEYCYAVGFFLAYFLLTVKERRSHILLTVLTFFLFFLGLKRSVLFGVGSAITMGILVSLIKKPRKLITVLLVLLMVLSIGYIVWVYYGLFDWLESVGLSTSGRNWLYAQIREYYTMSPAYFGRGAGFVSRSFMDGTIDLTNKGFTIGDIHNDYLRQYIEYGFWGYLLWLWLYTGRKLRRFFGAGHDAADNRRGVIAFAMTLVACVTCLTENTLYCYYATLAMAITIMGHEYEFFVKREKLPGE